MTATIPDEMSKALHECFGEPRHQREISIEYDRNGPYLNVKHMTNDAVTVVLSDHCAQDGEKLLFVFQLAHELVHTLDPVPYGEASVLEEGCATYFQYWYIRKHFPQSETIWHWPMFGSYKDAHELVRPIFEADFYALKRLRNSGFNLSLSDTEALTSNIPFIDSQHAQVLVQKYESWKKQ